MPLPEAEELKRFLASTPERQKVIIQRLEREASHTGHSAYTARQARAKLHRFCVAADRQGYR